ESKDMPGKAPLPSPPDGAAENELVVDEIVITPVGYAMRLAGTDQATGIIIDNMDLFQKYSVEQWNTMFVDCGTYLFDSYLFPDFAFQVIGVKPHAGKITPETRILFKSKNTTVLSRITPVGIADVIGQEEAKRKCQVILKYLADPDIFGAEWAPRNVLFHGPPGTGKTLMARALASEAKASFFARNATTLIGVHVGDGAKKIHDLYELATASAPCVVFVDELDAIGLNRSFQHVRGDVIEVSTALLAELDGMEANKGVVTIGATNQVGLLDPALRSRFEEEILFTSPNAAERAEIIDLYAGKAAMKARIDSATVASRIDGWTGRDIKEKLMKSLIHDAILSGKRALTTEMALELVARLTRKEAGSRVNPLSF
ncbi:MAG: AAA family ATPase, partial [Candidatus Lokiarchaeota archaeon]|nr:AAA family ATPase [Candidatus Lokiarchaeota archaeon]